MTPARFARFGILRASARGPSDLCRVCRVWSAALEDLTAHGIIRRQSQGQGRARRAMVAEGTAMTCPAIDPRTPAPAVSGYLSGYGQIVSGLSVNPVRLSVRRHSRTVEGHVGSHCPAFRAGRSTTWCGSA